MENERLKSLAIKTAVFSAAAIALCLWRAATKPIVIEGTVQAQESARAEEDDSPLQEIYDASVLDIESLSDDESADTDITIELPSNIRSEDISTENHYLSRQLWVVLRSSRADYGKKGLGVAASEDKVREGVYLRTDRSECSLRFGLTGLYEPQTSLADGKLKIKLLAPRDAYEHIILIDPLVSEGEGDAALDAAREISSIYGEDGSVRVYLTRSGAKRDEERSLSFISETGAELCIGLRAGGGDIGASYNEKWFLRRLTNARLASDLAFGTAAATGRRVYGLEAVGREDPFLAASTVPAAVLDIGNIRDEAEIAKAAEAVAGVIDGIFAEAGGESDWGLR